MVKLNNLSPNIIFDELQEEGNPTKMFFISSLLVIPSLMPRNNIAAKIYTSRQLARQIATYWSQYGVKLERSNFVKMEPNVPLSLQQHNDEECVEAVMFETEDISRNVMFLFRKAGGGRPTHLYAGICTELRSLLFNRVFVEWVRHGVAELYVDVSRASQADVQYPKELWTAIDTIEKIHNENPNHKLIIKVPRMGYENFVYNLSERLRARLSVGGIMAAVFEILKMSRYFASDFQDGKLLVVHKSFTLDEMETSHRDRKYIFIQITDKTNRNREQDFFYELGWSPLPSSFELQLLAHMTHPDRIYAFHYLNNDIYVPPQVPHYLLKLCRHYQQILEEMERAKDVEANMLEDLHSDNTELGVSSEAEMYNIKFTQDVDYADRRNLVCEWLTNKQNNGIEKSKHSDSSHEHKVVNQLKGVEGVRSSETNKLQTAKYKTDSSATSLKSKLCVVKKGKVRYLEESDNS